MTEYRRALNQSKDGRWTWQPQSRKDSERKLLPREKKAGIAVTLETVIVLNGMGVSLFHKLQAH
jgi:hypothetical protein